MTCRYIPFIAFLCLAAAESLYRNGGPLTRRGALRLVAFQGLRRIDARRAREARQVLN